MKNWSNILSSVIVGSVIAVPLVIAVKQTPPVPVVADNPPANDRVIDVQPTPPGSEIPVVQVEVGELIRLTAGGEHVAWSSVPAVADYVSYGEANGQCVMSFRKAGEYTVVLGVLTDGKVDIRKVVLQVGAPEPKPEILPPGVVTGWDAKVSAWLAGNPAAKVGAARLADSFAKVAASVESQITAGKLVTVDQINALTLQENQNALIGVPGDFSVFRNGLAAELGRMAAAGELSTMQQHVNVWKQIADALRRFASAG